MDAPELQIIVETVGDQGVDLVQVGAEGSQLDLLCIVDQMWIGVTPCCWDLRVLFCLT